MHMLRAVILLLCLSLCHSRNKTGSGQGKILGGRLAKAGEFPYVVVFSSSYICSGTLISLVQIMTSARCFYDKQKTFMKFWSKIDVIGGSLEINELGTKPSDVFAQVRRMTSLVFAEKFDEAKLGGKIVHHDVAFASVSKPFKETETLKTAPLPGKTASEVECKWRKMAKAGRLKCIVTGWGTTRLLNDGSTAVEHSKYMKVAEVTAMTDCKCKDEVTLGKVDGTLHGEVCLEPVKTGEHTCEGDQGAPIICNGMVFGVVTTSGCFVEADYSDQRKPVDKQYGILLWNYIENADLSLKSESLRLYFNWLNIVSLFFLI